MLYIRGDKMKKYNFTKAYNDNDLREIINTLEKNNFRLISTSTFNNCIYVFYFKYFLFLFF